MYLLYREGEAVKMRVDERTARGMLGDGSAYACETCSARGITALHPIEGGGGPEAAEATLTG